MSKDIFAALLASINGVADQEDIEILKAHSEHQVEAFGKKTIQPEPPISEMTDFGGFLSY